MSSYSGQVRFFRTKDRFHSSGLTSLGRQDFSKLQNIMLTTLSAVMSLPIRVDMIKGRLLSLSNRNYKLQFPLQMQINSANCWSGFA